MVPMYDFECSECDAQFESLIKPNEPVECPECRMRNCTRLVAVPSPHVWRGSSDGAEPKKTR